ncbi:MAG: prepilin peptidase [Terricaulis sp.]
MISLVALVIFAGLLVYAAFSDITSLTIPNWLSIAMAALFAPIALLQQMQLADIGIHYAFGFAVLAVGFFLFQAKIFGGGDAKLVAAAAVWTGFAAFPTFILGTALAGGVLALTLLSARKWSFVFAGAPSFVNRLLTADSGVPYGVAIMAGGLLALPTLPFFTSALTLP